MFIPRKHVRAIECGPVGTALGVCRFAAHDGGITPVTIGTTNLNARVRMHRVLIGRSMTTDATHRFGLNLSQRLSLGRRRRHDIGFRRR